VHWRFIELDVEARSLRVDLGDDELAQRRKTLRPSTPVADSGYQRLHIHHVLQADRGADLDFLVGRRGSAVQRNNHSPPTGGMDGTD
jgi:L-arabonate dehydrase